MSSVSCGALSTVAVVATAFGACSCNKSNPGKPDASQPAYIEPEWQAVIADYAGDIQQAVMLPDRIAVFTKDREIILVEKRDGRVVARTPWPGVDSSVGSAIARGSGNLAAVGTPYIEEEGKDALTFYEWSGTDLTLVTDARLGLVGDQATIAELEGQLYLLWNPEVSGGQLILVHVNNTGQITSQVDVTDGNHLFSWHGVAASDGTLLYCAQYNNQESAILFHIEPDTGRVEKLKFDGHPSSTSCEMVVAPDRILVYWRSGDDHGHWELVSRDGRTVLQSHQEIFDPVETHAYIDGDFATATTQAVTGQPGWFEVWAIDGETAELRGPYAIAYPPGYADSGEYRLVSDGDDLYAVIPMAPKFGDGEIRLLKLPPLPE